MAPRSLKNTLFLLSAAYLYLSPPVQAITTYANVFYNPDYFAAGNFNQSTLYAQKTIISWADDLASQGPWNVTSKGMTPPSGDKHDYMSFSPYAWPDCSGVGNTTELTPEQIWTTCPYVTRDGQFNPDARAVNDIGNFDDMADAVLYNTLAWVITGTETYAANAVNFIQSWFLNPDTAMKPNLNYAQMRRGPNGQVGTHTGVLDLKCMAKVANGILILRDKKAAEWTSDIDSKMVSWSKTYITWLQTASIAVEEAAATNNHGTFYYNQLAALQLLVGDKDAASKSLATYFNTLFLNQIAADGDQPLESNRTRPYHYRAYNLAAMITNVRLAQYAGTDDWNAHSSAGATIQKALDFAIAQQPGNDDPEELYPHVATVAVQYGDPDGKYGTFLKGKLGSQLTKAPYFLWDTFLVPGIPTPTSSASTHAPSKTSSASGSSTDDNSHKAGYKPSGALSDFAVSKSWYILYGALAGVVTVVCYTL